MRKGPKRLRRARAMQSQKDMRWAVTIFGDRISVHGRSRIFGTRSALVASFAGAILMGMCDVGFVRTRKTTVLLRLLQVKAGDTCLIATKQHT